MRLAVKYLEKENAGILLHGKSKIHSWKKFRIGICPKIQEVILGKETELEVTDCQTMPR